MLKRLVQGLLALAIVMSGLGVPASATVFNFSYTTTDGSEFGSGQLISPTFGGPIFPIGNMTGIANTLFGPLTYVGIDSVLGTPDNELHYPQNPPLSHFVTFFGITGKRSDGTAANFYWTGVDFHLALYSALGFFESDLALKELNISEVLLDAPRPTPLPPAAALFLGGLAALGLLARRKRNPVSI